MSIFAIVIGVLGVLSAIGWLKARKYKFEAEKNGIDCKRESLYGSVKPIKRVLLRYHKLMDPQEFPDVAHQQARFRGIEGALSASRRLVAVVEDADLGEGSHRALDLAKLHHDFLSELLEANDEVKAFIQEIPAPSHRPPSPRDLERKLKYLRQALDIYDGCLNKFNVEFCLMQLREIIEIFRFYSPEELVKPVIWEILIRNEHFLIELVNLLPEQCQNGTRTDAAMLQPVG